MVPHIATRRQGESQRPAASNQEPYGARSPTLSLLVMLMACEVARSSTSTTDALNERRIRHAAALLGEGGRSVEDVASACGFSDMVYFRRVFKKLQGLTPSAHRSLHT
jgi:AraC-like DNA-binding protein